MLQHSAAGAVAKLDFQVPKLSRFPSFPGSQAFPVPKLQLGNLFLAKLRFACPAVTSWVMLRSRASRKCVPKLELGYEGTCYAEA